MTDSTLPAAWTTRMRAADPIEQMAEADRADWALMRLVLCATLATFVLALAAGLH